MKSMQVKDILHLTELGQKSVAAILENDGETSDVERVILINQGSIMLALSVILKKLNS